MLTRQPATLPLLPASLPLLPTTAIRSYPVPERLERLKTDYYHNRISRTHFAEIHDMAIKAALKGREKVGVDIVSDGELRRDNDIDYLVARIAGVQVQVPVKLFYYGYYDAVVTAFTRKCYQMLCGCGSDRRFGWDRVLGRTLSAPVTTSSAIARPSDTRPQSPRIEAPVTCPEPSVEQGA